MVAMKTQTSHRTILFILPVLTILTILWFQTTNFKAVHNINANVRIHSVEGFSYSGSEALKHADSSASDSNLKTSYHNTVIARSTTESTITGIATTTTKAESTTNATRITTLAATTTGSSATNSTSTTRHGESQPVKIIYEATHSWLDYNLLNAEHCEFRNCRFIGYGSDEILKEADVAIFEFRNHSLPNLDSQVRQNQIWVMMAQECWAYKQNRLPDAFNGRFNATMTYRPDSTIVFPFGRIQKQPKSLPAPQVDYAKGKTKAAFVYVSNCQSQNYIRLGLIRALGHYIHVDMFGACTGNRPCYSRSDRKCEKEKHKQYRFYLSFENSLCQSFITEKFWLRLESDGYFVPVVVGGATISDYTNVAPPNSFIHGYSFSNTKKLGKYLQYLMSNDTAYNEYHAWRNKYKIYQSQNDLISCKLCEMANKKADLPAIPNIRQWWEGGEIGQLPY